jgi:hypothetical protein
MAEVFKFWIVAIHKNIAGRSGKDRESLYHDPVMFFPE